MALRPDLVPPGRIRPLRRSEYGVSRLAEILILGLAGRARVDFAASDDSEAEPDLAVVPPADVVVRAGDVLPPRR